MNHKPAKKLSELAMQLRVSTALYAMYNDRLARRLFATAALLVLTHCSNEPFVFDPGETSAPSADTAPAPTVTEDAGTPPTVDAAPPPVTEDAGAPLPPPRDDAGAPVPTTEDAGTPDAPTTVVEHDAGVPDATEHDAGPAACTRYTTEDLAVCQGEQAYACAYVCDDAGTCTLGINGCGYASTAVPVPVGKSAWYCCP